jgi:hypothetical protein
MGAYDGNESAMQSTFAEAEWCDEYDSHSADVKRLPTQYLSPGTAVAGPVELPALM